MRQKLFTIFIWLSVINLSIWIGGTLFHMMLSCPCGSHPIPGSIKHYFGGTRLYEYLLDFYGPKSMIFRIAPIIIALLLGWHSKRHRNFLLITMLTLVSGIIFTIFYVYPINDAIMARAGEGISADEIVRMVNNWILADRMRFGVVFIGYFFLLWAFRLPLPMWKSLR